jgi:hypothetical protein
MNTSNWTPWWRALGVLVVSTCIMPAASGQILQSKLIAADGDAADSFGLATALLPGWAFAASPYDDDVQSQSGAIHVFEQVGSNWIAAQKLKASDPTFGGALGTALAASGEWLVATTPFDLNKGNGTAAGSAHVYNLQGSVWVHTQKLLASDFATVYSEYFGRSAAIDGNVMVLGERDDNTMTTHAGSVYVFELQGTTWVETAKLYPLDWEPQGAFGHSVAIEGDTIVIGAIGNDNGSQPGADRGAAYVFQRAGSNWVQVQKLLPNDPVNGDLWGGAVGIAGDTIMVGGGGHNHAPGNGGAVYIFTKQGSSWTQTQEVFALDDWNPLGFGGCVAIDGDLAVVGAHSDKDLGNTSGSAYAFKRVGTLWTQIGKLLAPDGSASDIFGFALAIAGPDVLVGAWADDDACPANIGCNSGSAYVFDLAPDAVQYCHCTQIGPCGNHDDFGGCANSFAPSRGAILSAGGTSSVVADSLLLEARWLPPNIPGILFMGGAASSSLPFGDGRLCVGSGATGVFRLLPPKPSGPGGVMTWSGLVAMTQSNPPVGQIAPGQTWYFQAWYRDPGGPCGSGFNLSNGLQVTFTP